MRAIALAAVALVAAVACSSYDDGPSSDGACVQVPSADCKPLVDPPTYDAIYTQILRPTCGSAACHASGSVIGGLSFATAEASHAMLLGRDGATVRVVEGDPSCSPLMKRIMSDDPSYRMPRGSTPLSDAETCAITKWIAAGAQR